MKKISSILISLLLFIGIPLSNSVNVYALNAENTASNIDEQLNILFPEREQELKQEGFQNCAFSQVKYLKVSPKNKDNNLRSNDIQDYLFEEINEKTLDEAVKKEKNEKIKRSKGLKGLSSTGISGDNYLSLIINGSQNDQYKYRYKLEFTYYWVKSPTYNLIDVIGISVGNNMKINADSYNAQSSFSYSVRDTSIPGGQRTVVNTTKLTSFEHTNLGIAAKYDLKFGGDNFGKISCIAEFTTQRSGQTANIFGNYIHICFGFTGGVGIDYTGKPSMTLNKIHEMFSVPADIKY